MDSRTTVSPPRGTDGRDGASRHVPSGAGLAADVTFTRPIPYPAGGWGGGQAPGYRESAATFTRQPRSVIRRGAGLPRVHWWRKFAMKFVVSRRHSDAIRNDQMLHVKSISTFY